VIRPAIEDADLEPIRAGEDYAGVIIPKPTFEQLMLCDYVVADLTTANAGVLYELGVRHGLRPHSTVLIFAGGRRLPFDSRAIWRATGIRLRSRALPQCRERDRKPWLTS